MNKHNFFNLYIKLVTSVSPSYELQIDNCFLKMSRIMLYEVMKLINAIFFQKFYSASLFEQSNF
jgi:hypothetical protein